MTILLRSATTYLTPLLLLFSVFLLLRGHNDPGGGFVGGLVAASALALVLVVHGAERARRLLPVSPRALIGLGLGVALASAFVGPLLGLVPMEPLWTEGALPVLGKLGTPLLFDLGVYLLVIGVVSAMFLRLSEV